MQANPEELDVTENFSHSRFLCTYRSLPPFLTFGGICFFLNYVNTICPSQQYNEDWKVLSGLS